jgi:hypothetical protein
MCASDAARQHEGGPVLLLPLVLVLVLLMLSWW